ncbi:hypothetical protein ACFB49_34280 [Sphingomonas sp. DBB INV C78]|uniref:hypothetical protein n=1 Tax=Sphingomonas sp. DBB INV C78 TaxID=3349434 RepID=UPI0036D32C16
MRGRWGLAGLHLFGSIAVMPLAAAQAQEPTEIEIATRGVERACQDMAGRTIQRVRLEQALRTEARLNELAPDVVALSTPDFAERLSDRSNRLRGATALLQEQLAQSDTDLANALQVSPKPPPRGEAGFNNWLFRLEGGPPYKLTCAPASPEKPARFTRLNPVVIRGSVDELDDVGDDRLAASAARVGWDKLRSTNLKGETTSTTTVTIDAAAAIAFGNIDRYGMVYADYSYSRVRTKTSPVATPAEDDGRADDVDALELGALGTIRPASWLRATGRIGATFDYVTDAKFLHGAASLVPITGGVPDFGFCNLNMFKAIGFGIEGRCNVAAEADIRYVLKRGSADLDESDTLLGLGGLIGASFRRSLDANGNPQDGLVASVNYRYLPLVDGDGPDIDRIDASLGYRWWAGEIGFELGLTYADGTEIKSLADEHRVGITFGVIH